MQLLSSSCNSVCQLLESLGVICKLVNSSFFYKPQFYIFEHADLKTAAVYDRDPANSLDASFTFWSERMLRMRKLLIGAMVPPVDSLSLTPPKEVLEQLISHL